MIVLILPKSILIKEGYIAFFMIYMLLQPIFSNKVFIPKVFISLPIPLYIAINLFEKMVMYLFTLSLRDGWGSLALLLFDSLVLVHFFSVIDV
jgi:hypothetical protein